eukprot:TRINITY_DN2845_c0_g1_i1.p2 TRINITY_DN2845_c0_g1~~TRINITY_DN2845_c0_g1_i1.p2  ORF type:complete len:103 (+),score=20.77 TRINITY_DN2845_c0_g1_i1:242-550(+)
MRLYQIKNIIFMGGVADCGQVAKIIKDSEFKGKVVNVYSSKDQVLQKFLPLSQNQSNPLGLTELYCYNTTNIDLSDDNIGHTNYEENHLLIVKKILKKIEMQ